MRTATRHAVVAGALVLAGCGGDEGDGADETRGTAPGIEALSLETDHLVVGEQTALSGRFAFHDTEGDADRFAAAITLPSGARQSVPPSKTQGTSGLTEGEVMFLVAVAPPEEGTYTLEIWMLDEADNESNHLDAALEAGPAPDD